MMLILKRQSVKLRFQPYHSSYDQVNITSLIKALPWSIRWIRVWNPKCLEERQRRVSSFNGSYHGRPTPSRSNVVDIMMYAVNIEERTKVKCQVLALSLFSSLSTLHLTHPRLKDRGSSWHLSLIENSRQLIMLREIAWLVQLKL